MAQKQVLKVTGMSCAHCEKRVENAVSAVPGVFACKASAKKGELTVKGEPELQAVRKAVEEAGYKVQE